MPSIRPWVYDICPPPYEMIEEKLDYLSEKVDQVHQAVEDLDCGGDGSGSDDKGMKVAVKKSSNIIQFSSQ